MHGIAIEGGPVVTDWIGNVDQADAVVENHADEVAAGLAELIGKVRLE